eukprot:7858114-Pyramimonas_sp.AAC.1
MTGVAAAWAWAVASPLPPWGPVAAEATEVTIIILIRAISTRSRPRQASHAKHVPGRLSQLR